jgi:hypothetical protein
LDEQQVLAPPGRYTLRLDGTTADGRTARSWATTVTITSPVTLDAPALGGWSTSVPLTGTTKANTPVQVDVRTKGTDTWVPAATVTSDADGHYAASFTLTDDTDVRATASGYPSEVKRVLVAPLFTPSSPTELGSTLTLSGTARPGSAVDLAFKRPTGTSWNGRHATADAATGAWSIELPMNGDWTLTATADTVSTPAVAVYVTPTLDAAETFIGALGSPIPVSGTAAPSTTIDLQVQPTSAGAWTTVGQAKSDSTGTWTASVPLSDDLEVRAGYHGLGSTQTRAARVRPTAVAPSSSGWNTTVPLRGTARPGATVTVSRTVAGVTSSATTVASTAGAWSAPFTLTDATTWSATAGGLGSASGTTRVMPSVVLPSRSVVGRTIRVSGTARPGSAVVPAIRQPGSSSWTTLRAVTTDSTGNWTAYLRPSALGTAAVTAQADGVTTAARALPVLPMVVSAVRWTALGSTVTLKGVARPSSSVRVDLFTAGRWVGLRWVRSDATGAWATTYPLRTDTWARGVSADGLASALTRVRPTLSAPASARAGSTIGLRGTARPGSRVWVYIRYATERTAVARRSATATSSGYWAVSWPFRGWIATYAVSGGLRSVTRVTAVQ